MAPFDAALTDDLGDQHPDTSATDIPDDVWATTLRQVRLTGTADVTGDTLEISGFAKVTDIGAGGAAQTTASADATIELVGECGAAARHVVEEAVAAGLNITVDAHVVVTSDGVALPGRGQLLIRGRDIYAGPATVR